MLKDAVLEIVEKEERECHDVLTIEEGERWWIIGTFKVREMRRKGKARAIVLRDTREFEFEARHGLDIPIIPSDIAKGLLKVMQTEGKTHFSRETLDRLLSGDLYHPLFASPGRIEEAVYIDLSNAYFTIIKAYFPCQYKRGAYLSIPYSRYIEDEDVISKLAKVSTISVLRSMTYLLGRKNGNKMEFKIVKKKNVMLNDVVALVYDYLHALGLMMVKRFGAIYVHTDGYIVEAKRVHEVAEFLNEYWIGKWKIKWEGIAEVKGAGGYKIGEHTSGTYNRFIIESPINNLNISEDTAKWLLEVIKRHKQKYLQQT